jgi:hypothetical protein
VIGIRNPVVDDKNKNMPNQSTRRSLARKELVDWLRLRKRKIARPPMKMKGRLIQKILLIVSFMRKDI